MAKLHYEARPEPRRWENRALWLAAGAIELIFFVLAYSGASWPVVIYQLLADGAVLALWLAAAMGVGALVLGPLWRLDGEAPAALRRVTEVAVGLGVFSLTTLGLGLAGWLNRGTAVGLILGGLAASALAVWRSMGGNRSHGLQTRATKSAARGMGLQPVQAPPDGTGTSGFKSITSDDLGAPLRAWLAESAGWDWLWLLVVPLLVVAVVGALVPPGFLWTPDEPHGYDVVGYHLQIPREWYEAGRISPLEHNVFSYFPFGVEMHYLLAMYLRGGAWKGMYLAQLMHVAHLVLSVLAVYHLACSLSKRRATAVAAALIAASVPWLTLLAPVAYNEGGLLLHGTLAIGWALRGTEASSRISAGRFAIAGAMAGLACGVKLTAVPMLLAAVPVAVVAMSPRHWKHALVYGVVGAALYGPWALRNVAWAGNPVFPEAARLLGRAHFSEEQVERWERAHSPRPDQRPVGARLAALGREVAADWRFGYVPLAVGVVAALVAYRDRRARVLALLLVGYLVFWLALTHLQGRFFVLAVPVAALLVATADWGRLAPAVAGVVGACAVASAVMVHRPFSDRLSGSQRMAGVLAVEDLSGVNPPAVANVPADATLVLVGEARAFWFSRPMNTLRYRTVFDVDASAQPDVVQAWRGPWPASESEWLLVNPSELQRFADTYWAIPQPPSEWKGKVEPALIRPGPRPQPK